MASSTSGFKAVGKFRIPVGIWELMQKEYRNTMEGSDTQIGCDLSGSTTHDCDLDGESDPQDPSRNRLSEIRKGVKAIGGQALKSDDEIETWRITSRASSGSITWGVECWEMKRHIKGFKDIDSINKFADELTSGGGTPLLATLKEALDAYIEKVKNNPETKALTLIFFLDGVDDSMARALKHKKMVDLAPLKVLVMDAAAYVRTRTGCTDVRDKLGVQFCLVTGNSNVIEAYAGFDDAAMYTDPKTGEKFECDIFDCTTRKEVMEMGGWDSPLTHMKLIGGARNEKLDNILKYLRKFTNSDPPSFEDCMRNLDQEKEVEA